jgi:chromosome segregation ATPase
LHLLTKLFIVLVSLLAVMITPLVAVNAVNEDSFKSKWVKATQGKNVAIKTAETEKSIRHAETAAASVQVKELEIRIAELQRNSDGKNAEVSRLQGELTIARAGQEAINARIDMMAETQQAQQKLGETLVVELRSLRTRAVDAERQSVDLQDALEETKSEFAVADAARRALQEDLQQLKDERNAAVAENGRYVARFGELGGATRTGIPADRDLSATVINVRRTDVNTIAEINAGSRDGIQEGWVFTVADGSKFIGNLRITRVDVNRATGEIELEDVNNRGSVRSGQRAIARKGK